MRLFKLVVTMFFGLLLLLNYNSVSAELFNGQDINDSFEDAILVNLNQNIEGFLIKEMTQITIK